MVKDDTTQPAQTDSKQTDRATGAGDASTATGVPADRRTVLKALGASATGTALLDADAIGDAGGATYQGPPRSSGTNMPTYGDTWTSTLMGAGGKINGITTCPSDGDVVYLWTDVGDAWRSDDAGQTWYALRNGHGVRTLTVDPRNADTVVAAYSEGLYRTENGGDTWSFVAETQFEPNGQARDSAGDVISRNPADPDELLAAPIQDNLLRSTDGGNTWTALETTPADLYPTDVWHHPNRPDHVFLCYNDYDDTSRTGVARSTDGGETWSVVMSASEHPSGLALDPGNDDIIYGSEWKTSNVYRSTDGGASWSTHDSGLSDAHKLYDIWSDSSAVYVGGAEAIYRLPAGGSTWSSYTESTTANYDVSDWFFGAPDMIGGVAIDQNDTDIWYMGGTYAHFKSTDHGNSWSYSSRGIEEMVGMDIDTDPRNDTLHCAVADTKYFRLKNDGTEIDIHREPAPHALRNIVTAESNPDRVVASSWLYAGSYEFHPSGSLYLSDDAGNSWSKINGDGLPIEDSAASWTGRQLERYAGGLDIHPADPDTIVVGIANYGCYRTTDGGSTFSRLGDVSDMFSPLAGPWSTGSLLAISGDGSMVATSVGSNDVIAAWDPSSSSWTRYAQSDLPFGKWHPKHVVADPNTDGRFLFAHDNEGLYESTDGGNSWSQLHSDGAVYAAFDPNNPGRIVMARNNYGPMLSTDDGSTWQNLAGDHLLAADDEQSLAFSGDNVVASTGGVSYMWIPISDAGSDTTPPDPVPSSLDVTAVSDESLAVDFAPSIDWGSGVARYNVYLDGSKQLETSRSSVLVAGIAGNTTYEVTVSAVDGAGNESVQSQAVTATTDDPADLLDRSGWSASASATTVEKGTAANTIDGDRGTEWRSSGMSGDTLSVDMGGAETIEKIKLVTGEQWGDPPENYAVEVSSDGSSWQRIATGYGDSSNDEWITVNAFPATTAQHVRVVLTSDEGAWDGWEVQEFQVFASSTASGDTFDPSAPANLRSPSSNESSIDLAWDAASDEGGSGLDHYNVYVDGFKKTEVAAGTTSTTVSVPSPGSYDIFVTAVDAAGNQSPTSNMITVSTDSTPPTTPSNLSSPFKTASSVDLDWDASSDADTGLDHYNVYVDGSKDHQVGAGSTDSSVDHLSSASAYEFHVTAVDTVGNESSASNTITVTTEDKTVADIQLPKASTAPTIDASADDVWSSVSATALETTLDGSPSDSDLSATWKALWDDTNLYYLVDVTDDTLTNDSDATINDDAVELYLDPDNSGGGSYDGTNDYQLVYGYNDSSVVAGANSASDTTGMTFATTSTSDGWRMEAKIPWSTLGVTPSTGQVIGTDVHAVDDDDGSGRDAKVSWNDPKDQAWQTPRLFGRAKLVLETDSSAASGLGEIGRELWTNVSGTSVSAVPTGTTPDQTETVTTGLHGKTDWADSYATRIEGYLVPPADGDYEFWITSDDSSAFWLSTDDTTENAQQIVSVDGWCSDSEWGKYASQGPTTVSLSAGERYYLKVLHKEGPGSDHVKVGWRKPGDSTGSTPAEVVPASQLSPLTAGSGAIGREFWTNVNGNTTGDIPTDTTPDQTDTVSDGLHGRADWGENYGTRIEGYITAPESGEYTFWIASDNCGDLYLSSDDTTGNAAKIAEVNGWTGSKEWNKYSSQQSATQTLSAGERYYVKALHKERHGGDHVQIGWRTPSDGTGTAPTEIVPGRQLSPITAGAGPNHVSNPGFEADGTTTQTPSGWTTWVPSGSGDADADYTEDSSSGGPPHSGSYHATHWKSSAYTVSTSQTITGLDNGTYRATAWVRCSGGQNSARFEVKNHGNTKRTAAPPATDGWMRVELNAVEVTDGQATVGFFSDANGGDWFKFDDVVFERTD